MTYEVYVDVDRKGGDDDVFSVRCRNIEANNEQDACEKAEKLRCKNRRKERSPVQQHINCTNGNRNPFRLEQRPPRDAIAVREHDGRTLAPCGTIQTKKPVQRDSGPRVMIECAGCFNRYYNTVSACPVCGSTERQL